jgi:hypothetical protein
VPQIFPFMAYKYNLVRRTKATIVGSGRDGAGLQVVPSNGRGSRATGTVQRVFLRTSCRMRYEVRSVAIGTKANDIASKAIPTLHTVANTETHREHSIKIECGTDDGRRFVDLSPSSSILGTQPLRPVGAKVFLHSDIAEDLCWASERGRLGFDWTNIRR